MEASIRQANTVDAWFSALFLLSGSLALFMARIGLYGVMAFRVARRTREIGVRMALGGERGTIVWLVLRQGMAQNAKGSWPASFWPLPSPGCSARFSSTSGRSIRSCSEASSACCRWRAGWAA